MFKNSYLKFRVISFIEGLSYLILVFLAMPLKYLGGNLTIVKDLGMFHGVLFILFVLSLYIFKKQNSLEKELAWDYFVFSLVPFGFLLIESSLKRVKPKKITLV